MARAVWRESFGPAASGEAYSRLLRISSSNLSETEAIKVAVRTFNSEEWMDFSSKKPGNNRRNKSRVMEAMAVLDGRFLPST